MVLIRPRGREKRGLIGVQPALKRVLCPWNYFSQLWLSRLPDRKVWRHKRVPYRTESDPYWEDYAKGQRELDLAFRLTQKWYKHGLGKHLEKRACTNQFRELKYASAGGETGA